MENYALYFYLAGAGLALIGWLWLLVVACRQRFWWGLGLFIFPPLALIFIPKHAHAAWKPFVLMVVGGAIVATPLVYVQIYPEIIDLGPRKKTVDGEIHLTLTGWDRKDYNVLMQEKDAAVLQMANADVTDATLELVRDMKNLHKLDIGNSQVTDAGLKALKELPKLKELYLNGTKITDQGFKDSLAGIETLERLDLRGTVVTEDTIKEWRKGNTRQRAMLK